MRSPNNVGRVTKLTTLKGKQANALYWSPIGRFCVLAGLKAYNGQLEFYNVDELETMATAEHFMATDVDWDPTGRQVSTLSLSHSQIPINLGHRGFTSVVLRGYRVEVNQPLTSLCLRLKCLLDTGASWNGATLALSSLLQLE
jgi:uncharacterized protein with WD repeat